MKPVKVFYVLLFSWIGVVFNYSDCLGQTIYSIDFSSPPHQVGAPPAAYGGPHMVSSIPVGNPIVVSTFGSMTDQPLLFSARTSPSPFNPGYDQIKLDIGGVSDLYLISFDLMTHGVANSFYDFAVILDAPTVSSLRFYGQGSTINAEHPYEYYQPVQPLVDDHIYHVEMILNYISDTWSINLDNQPVAVLPFQGTELRSVRFNFETLGSQDSSIHASLDNILVVASPIPEPNFSAFLILGFSTFFLRGLICPSNSHGASA